MTTDPEVRGLIDQLRQPLIADALEAGWITSGIFAERLINERMQTASALERAMCDAENNARIRAEVIEAHLEKLKPIVDQIKDRRAMWGPGDHQTQTGAFYLSDLETIQWAYEDLRRALSQPAEAMGETP